VFGFATETMIPLDCLQAAQPTHTLHYVMLLAIL